MGSIQSPYRQIAPLAMVVMIRIIMKTNGKIIAWVFVMGILFSSCTSDQFSTPTLTPTSTQTLTQTSIPSQTPTMTPPPSATATSIPTWITNFAEPILQFMDNRPADFEDDFSQNRGWRHIPYGGSKPLGATVQNGVLSMPVTSTDAERAQGWVEHPRLTGRNFALAFDFSIDDGAPDDHVVINWFAKTSFTTLWLNQNDVWSLQANNPKISGDYHYNSSSQNSVLIIARDYECGIYVNNAAIAYLSECRTSSSGRDIWIGMQAVAGSHTAVMNIDNVKFWNLDNISNSP